MMEARSTQTVTGIWILEVEAYPCVKLTKVDARAP